MANENTPDRNRLEESGPDPIANTQAFRAFAGEPVEPETGAPNRRNLLALAVAVLIVVVVLVIWLATR